MWQSMRRARISIPTERAGISERHSLRAQRAMRYCRFSRWRRCMAIHSCSLGAPVLLEEAQAAGLASAHDSERGATPACDKMRAAGQWNEAWNPFFELDPVWTDEFMATGVAVYGSGLMPPKLVELLSIAFDASYTHMYAPGTRRHIKSALKLGCSLEEIMDVLKLCVAQGVQACNMGIPILEEELAKT